MKTFKKIFSGFSVKIECLKSNLTPREKSRIIESVQSGDTDILIGTHRIVNKDMIFKDLGLMIIDEEQKFGVGVKDQLKNIK